MMPGGWTGYSSEVTTDQKDILKKALKDFVGATYEPIGIQTQVVAGENYCFFCIGKMVIQDPVPYLAKVKVNKNLDGEIKLTGIEVVHPY